MKPRLLTVLEKEKLLSFLEELSDHYGNAGCNDYTLPNDAPHRLLMERVIKVMYQPKDQAQQLEWLAQSGKKIITMDSTVLGYIIECVAALPVQGDADAGIPSDT